MPTKRKDRPVIALAVPVTIKGAEGDDPKGPPTFDVTAYNGGALEVAGWDRPIVIDVEGLSFKRNVVANLDHSPRQRVGHVTDKTKDDHTVMLSGVFSAATPYRDEVVNSASGGFEWEASVEVTPTKTVEVEAGKTVTVNGQEFSGPLYVARKGVLSGFAFVSHGADPDTVVSIAAQAASHKEQKMKPEIKAWVESLGLNPDELTEDQAANITADYEGREGKRTKTVAATATSGIEKRKLEADRRKQINAMAEQACDDAIEAGLYEDVDIIRDARDSAIKGGMSIGDFRYELMSARLTNTPPRVSSTTTPGLTDNVLEAAICQAGTLDGYEKDFNDQTLQAAHSMFKGRIGLGQIYNVAAQANGYQGMLGGGVSKEVHNAAFGMGMQQRPGIRAAGFSTINLPNVFSNVANKFLRAGWDAVDQTPLRVAAIRPVNDFKQVTTVSLTGAFQFLPIGVDGQLKHAVPGEQSYTNQVSPAGIIFAVTFVDIRNDDLGALTAVPRKLGRGGMLYLNHIFWTEFLNNSSFFTSGNSNVNEGVADMTVGGLAATEVIFMNQTDYDSKPLGVQPAILLVPTALKASALTLMSSERLIDGTATAAQGDANIWRGRFRVESSPYMSNSAYTGYSAAAWYMLADPSVLPVIEIAALDGQVMPTVETADAAFNTLGTEMRGHSHVGVNLQEKKGGVRADGGAS